MFFENPVKLPFLNVELPLLAFFVLGPLLFLIVHAYTLLHFAMLAGKVGAFHVELETQIRDDETRASLRRQLPTNIFVQFLAGPHEVRAGVFGLMLRSIAWISLIIGPIALLVFFQLQFLPYHNEAASWWQRIAFVIDMVLLWALWPFIGRGTNTWLIWRDFLRARIAGLVLVSVLPVLLVFAVATFPGEWLHETIPVGPPFVPTSFAKKEAKDGNEREKIKWTWPGTWEDTKPVTLQEFLVGGKVDDVAQRPRAGGRTAWCCPASICASRRNST